MVMAWLLPYSQLSEIVSFHHHRHFAMDHERQLLCLNEQPHPLYILLRWRSPRLVHFLILNFDLRMVTHLYG